MQLKCILGIAIPARIHYYEENNNDNHIISVIVVKMIKF